MGFPTMSLRPTTTARVPRSGTFSRRSSSRIPAGVQGTAAGLPCRSRPAFSGWNPSASFARVDRLEDAGGRDVLRERELDEDPVHGVVAVQPVDRREELGLAEGRGEAQGPSGEARLSRGGFLVRDVDGAGGVLAHEDDREPGNDAPGGEARRAGGGLGPEGLRDGGAVENSGCCMSPYCRSERLLDRDG